MFHLNVVRYYTTLFLPIPKEISDKLSIVEGETFAMIVESKSSFRLVRTKDIIEQWIFSVFG